MQLNDDERAMLDGRDGAAVQRAMDLLNDMIRASSHGDGMVLTAGDWRAAGRG